MPVRSLQIFVLEESRGRQYHVGVIGGVGQKLLVHYGKQVGTFETSNHFIVIGTSCRRIRAVNEQRLDWRIIESVKRLAQFHHVDSARLATERFKHEVFALQSITADRSKGTAGGKLQAASDLLPRTRNTRQHRYSTRSHTT